MDNHDIHPNEQQLRSYSTQRLYDELKRREFVDPRTEAAEREAGYWKWLAEKLQRDKNALAAHVEAMKEELKP